MCVGIQPLKLVEHMDEETTKDLGSIRCIYIAELK